jgi:hypothetical protein
LISYLLEEKHKDRDRLMSKNTQLHAALNHDRSFIIGRLKLQIIKINSKQFRMLISDRTVKNSNCKTRLIQTDKMRSKSPTITTSYS